MSINGVSSPNAASVPTANASTVQGASNSQNSNNASQTAEAVTTVAKDAYVGSVETADTKTYAPPKKYEVDQTKVNEALESHKNNVGAFQQMVKDMISKQGKDATSLGIDLSADDGIAKLRKAIESGDLVIDDETKAKAVASIGEEGEWGVEAVSDRLVDFAKKLSGGDPSKYEDLLDGIKKGFGEAAKAYGDNEKVPEITQKTYDATMKKMEQWYKEMHPETAAANNSKAAEGVAAV